MSRKLTEAQLAEKDILDMVRTKVRLDHRILQRHELNDLEATVLGEFERRVSAGEPYQLSAADIFKEDK